MTQDRSDPVIDEIREIRQRISAKFDNDPALLVAHYVKLQERHGERLISPPEVPKPADESAA